MFEELVFVAKLRPYYVLSPEYDYVEPVLDYGQGPLVPGQEYEEVWAPDSKRAIVLGVKQSKANQHYDSYWRWGWDSAKNPFAGWRAKMDRCYHGTLIAFQDPYEICGWCRKDYEQAMQVYSEL